MTQPDPTRYNLQWSLQFSSDVFFIHRIYLVLVVNQALTYSYSLLIVRALNALT